MHNYGTLDWGDQYYLLYLYANITGLHTTWGDECCYVSHQWTSMTAYSLHTLPIIILGLCVTWLFFSDANFDTDDGAPFGNSPALSRSLFSETVLLFPSLPICKPCERDKNSIWRTKPRLLSSSGGHHTHTRRSLCTHSKRQSQMLLLLLLLMVSTRLLSHSEKYTQHKEY